MTEPTTTTGIGDRDPSQVAREHGRQIKGTARDAASDIATTAGERTRDIREQAASHVRGIAAEARRQLRDRIEQETEHAGSALSRAGSQLQALTEGRTDETGVFGEYAEQAAQTVNRWADSIQDRGLDGLLDDLRSVGRRRPGAFLLGAMAAGMIAGRFGRNLRQEMSESSDRGPGDGSNALVSGPAAGPGQTADRYLTTERTAEVDVPVRSMP
jgi:gas vesicle protein